MCLTATLMRLECVMVVVEPLGCFSLFANLFHGGYLLHPLTKCTCTWGTLLSITFPIMAIQMHIYEHVSLSEMYRHRHIEIYAYIYIYIYMCIFMCISCSVLAMPCCLSRYQQLPMEPGCLKLISVLMVGKLCR